MRVRWPFLLAFGVLVVVLGAVGLAQLTHSVREALPVNPARALAAAGNTGPTAIRRGLGPMFAPEIVPPPAPVGSALPLVGDPNARDRYGVPLRTADRGALLGLLYRERYAELTAHFEEFQRAFEADPLLERRTFAAHSAFDAPRVWQPARLDAWVRASPESFAPYLARGIAKTGTALAIRGMGTANQVADSEFSAMNALFAEARADLERAIALHPRLSLAHVTLMRMERFGGGREEAERHYAAAIAQCPQCLTPRVTQQHFLRPQWGGTPGERARYVAEESARWNDPRSAVLRARVAMDDCEAVLATDVNRGMRECAQVIAGVDDPWVLYRFARLLWIQRNDPVNASLAIDRALELDPHDEWALDTRVELLLARDQYAEAARAMHALNVAGVLHQNADLTERVVSIIAERNRPKTGTRAERIAAMEEVTLARTLLPLDRGLQYTELALLGYTGPPSPGQRADAALVAAAAAAPDDLFAQREADLTLSLASDYASAAALWERYLARHPESARAHLEYAGALTHLQRADEAHREMTRGCDLGELECCLRIWNP